jgi:hypothetical protein
LLLIAAMFESSDSLEAVGGLMVSVVDWLIPNRVALMEATVTELTAEVLILNVAEVAPAFTWTVWHMRPGA